MEKSFRRMKVLINLVAFYLRRFQKYELVGPWRHDPDVKEKGKDLSPPLLPPTSALVQAPVLVQSPTQPHLKTRENCDTSFCH